jgi:hypothetical protein
VIVEYADAGTLEEVFDLKRTKNELLQIAYNVTVALVDAHNLDQRAGPLFHTQTFNWINSSWSMACTNSMNLITRNSCHGIQRKVNTVDSIFASRVDA